jgi:hypothetical protein
MRHTFAAVGFGLLLGLFAAILAYHGGKTAGATATAIVWQKKTDSLLGVAKKDYEMQRDSIIAAGKVANVTQVQAQARTDKAAINARASKLKSDTLDKEYNKTPGTPEADALIAQMRVTEHWQDQVIKNQQEIIASLEMQLHLMEDRAELAERRVAELEVQLGDAPVQKKGKILGFIPKPPLELLGAIAGFAAGIIIGNTIP